MSFKLLAILILCLACWSKAEDAPRVKTPLGSLRGYYKVSENGRLYEAYEGVPYAKAPIGKRRFKPPKPIEAWPGELPATKLAHECLQYNHVAVHLESIERLVGSEDCLYLNIYVPEREEANVSKLPVLFWIHGGAMMHGSANDQGPKYLMDKDLVFVTVNYRLGPLGFLSTEDQVVPGNMGLKDQSLALRWVHDNIEYFGGDPQRLTIGGLSAGGVSAHYHYFSAMSAGLFRSGFSLSGTVLNCWAQTERSLDKAKKLGALMGCPTDGTREMVKCLRQRPARQIVQAVKEFTPWLYNPFTPFGPVVEKGGDKPFIDRPPVDILESGEVLDVPWFTSVTKDEGLYPVAEFALKDQLLKELDDKWTSLAPFLLDFNYTVADGLQASSSMKIRKHYLGNGAIDKSSVKSLIKMVGDRMFVVDAARAAKMQAKANKNPVWFYYFTYRGAGSLSDCFSGTKENLGVSHADDAFYVLDTSAVVDPTSTENDRAMQRDLLRLWASFVEKGEQGLTKDWKKIDPVDEDLNYLHISGPGSFEMSTGKDFGNEKFWKSMNFVENVVAPAKAKDEM